MSTACRCGHPLEAHTYTDVDPATGRRLVVCMWDGECACTAFTHDSSDREAEERAGGGAGTAGASAATPAPGTPDPMVAAAIRTLPDRTAFAAGVDPFVVPLDVAKRIRDEAIADLKAELDGAYDILTAVAGAIARHLPDGTNPPETLIAGIAAVHDHAFAQGAAHAAAEISDAIKADLDEDAVIEMMNGQYAPLDPEQVQP
jgi:hypothetical protein